MSEHSVEISGRPSVYHRLRAEFLDVLPAVVFFFLSFNLINVTHALFFHKQHIALYSELNLLIGAAIAGKVLALVDLLPFLNLFHGNRSFTRLFGRHPSIQFGGLLFRYCEFLAPFISEYKGLGVAIRHLMLEEDWFRFWGVQLWVFVILFVYIATRETIEAIGGERLRLLFFGF